MLLPRLDEDTECSGSNMAGGALRLNTLIEHMADMGKLNDVGMEREDLGLMMFTFCEVGLRVGYSYFVVLFLKK